MIIFYMCQQAQAYLVTNNDFSLEQCFKRQLETVFEMHLNSIMMNFSMKHNILWGIIQGVIISHFQRHLSIDICLHNKKLTRVLLYN